MNSEIIIQAEGTQLFKWQSYLPSKVLKECTEPSLTSSFSTAWPCKHKYNPLSENWYYSEGSAAGPYSA